MVAPDEAGDLSRSLVRIPGSGYDRTAAPATCDLGRVSSLAATVPINPKLPPMITNIHKVSPSSRSTSEAKATVDKMGCKSDGPMRQARAQPTPTQPCKRPLVPASTNPTPTPTQVPSNTQSRTATTTSFSAIPLVSNNNTMELPVGFMANKRARITYLTPEQAVRYAPNILHVNTHAGPVLFMPVQQEGNKPNRPKLIPARSQLQARTMRQQVTTRQQASAGQQASEGQSQVSTGHQEVPTGSQGSGLTVVTLEQLIRQQSHLREENAVLQKQVTIFQQLFQNPERLEAVVRQLGIKVDTQ